MVDVKEKELEIQKFWDDNDIQTKARKVMEGKKKWYFLDGPPYATGYIHIGTAWNKILKDTYIRYKRMKGFDVWDQPGYDTHGLPIENKIEKKLGLKSKQDIERLGVEKFNQECKKFVTGFIDIMNDQFKNLGVWMNWDDPYITFKNEYIEGAWHTFKIGFEKGLLYKDRYSVHVCPHCETAVAYNEIEYTKLTDPSVYVKFPVKGEKDTYFLIWTTTPWTLPSNTGIMAKPSANYVYVKIGKETLIFAKELVEKVMKKTKIQDYKIQKTAKGKKLEGMEYNHPLSDLFPFHKKIKNAWRIVLSEQYVTLDEGTGLVHTAPGHGEEDYKVGKENNLPIISPLNMNGTYNDECGPFSGKLCKSCDDEIAEILKERGLLLHKESVTHDYPQCWRCSSPLLFMAVPQWFFRVTKIRDKLIEENKKVNWTPKWAGKRFHNWLESLGDWPITRQRYWGIPLPIWECEKCEHTKVIGSTDELPEKPKDLHKPYVDEIHLVCEKCGGKMNRIPDVLDVWFDSGVAGWASLGYPRDKKLFKKLWPNDFNLEGPDQIRGWWNSQLITSVITFDRRSFENIVFHGFVLDAHGNKMSKSKGNIVAPEDVIDKYGRDVLRYYLLSSAPWDDFYFNWVDTENVAKMMNIIKNTFRFVKTYVKEVPDKKSKLTKDDEWILSSLNSTIKKMNEWFDKYHNHKALEVLQKFILDDYSRWYIKLIRNRTWPGYEGKDKEAAFWTLGTIVETLTRLLAPTCPFIAEQGYQEVVKSLMDGKESVHLTDYPEPDKSIINEELEKEMEIVEELVENSLAARQKANLKLRWPVEGMYIDSIDETVKKAVENLEETLKRMANVKKIHLVEEKPKGELAESEFDNGKIYLDLTEDQELMEERLYRELTRIIQSMRKKQKLVVSDKIELNLKSDPKTEKILEKFTEDLKKDVGASKVDIGSSKDENKQKMEFKGMEIEIFF
jgi:isoleucyl-tRNA synthetase